MKRLLTIATIAATIAANAACTEGNGPGSLAAVQVSFATQQPGGALASRMALSASAMGDTLVEGTDTLVIDRAQIVLREIEIKKLNTDDCDSAVDEDACERFETGPVLVDLPLGATVQQTFALDIPAGTYTEIEFDIHKPDDGDPVDQAFVAANPAFADISIRVQGSYNGQDYTFTTDLNVEQELALIPPIEIQDATSATNVTILVDIDTWFRRATGALVNPATANKDGNNEGLVKENIKNSVEAFEDEDHDGDDD